MRNPLCLVTFIGLLLATTSLRLFADMTPYIGRWQVDVPATLEAAKQSPGYNADEAERAKPALIKKLETMRLKLTPERLKIGTTSVGYTFKDTTDGITTITMPSLDNTTVFTFKFTTVGPKQMRFTASTTKEMDFIIWTPATGPDPDTKPAPTIQGNLRAIEEAAEFYSLMNNTQTVPYDALVKEKIFKPLESVNGEDYATVVIDLANKTASVTDKDGMVHTYKKP